MKFKNLFKVPNTPIALTWDEWDKFWDKAKEEHPVRYFLSKTLSIFLSKWYHKLWKQPIYWLRTHTIDKYHLIDIRNPRNGYDWGWIDRDRGILFAAFAVFNDFMEKEYPTGCVDWDWNWHAEEYKDDPDAMAMVAERRKMHQEMKDLYQWWKVDRKNEWDFSDKLLSGLYKDVDPIDELLSNKTDEERDLLRKIHWIYQETLDNKDQEMLHRLINIRQILWT